MRGKSSAAGAPASVLLPIRVQVQMRADDFTTERINQGYGMILWHRWCEERQPRSTGYDEWEGIFAHDVCVI